MRVAAVSYTHLVQMGYTETIANPRSSAPHLPYGALGQAGRWAAPVCLLYTSAQHPETFLFRLPVAQFLADFSLDRPPAGRVMAFGVIADREILRQLQDVLFAMDIGERVIAVSYTHLDVYKRQP